MKLCAAGEGGPVEGGGGGHGTRDALEAGAEVRDGLLGVRRNDGDTVAGRHKEARAQNHVAIRIAVARRAKRRHRCKCTRPGLMHAWNLSLQA